MQLCFIWVSSYRNIGDQGFNLGSAYHLAYDRKKSYLNIHKNPKYIPDFFGKDIVNVTGIVGENAAGKTNVLELINYMMDGGNTRIAAPFIMVFEDSGLFRVFGNQVRSLESNQTVEFEPYSGGKLPMESAFFTNIFDGRRYEFGENIHDLSTNRILHNQFGENIQTNLKREVQGQIRFLQSTAYRRLQEIEQLAYPDTVLDIKPAHVQFISPAWENINNRARNFDRLVSNTIGEKFTSLNELCQSFRKQVTMRQTERTFIYFTSFLLLLDFLSNEFIPDSREIGKKSTGRVVSADQLRDELSQLGLMELKRLQLNDLHEAITGPIALFIDKNYPHTFEKFKFLKEMDSYYFPALEKQTEGTYNRRKFQFSCELSTDVERFIRGYMEATTQLNLSYTIEWLGISSGQRAFMNMLSRMYSISGTVKNNNLLITIDEGDLYFHPRWQVEYLSRLIRVLPLIFTGKKLQLVLTTHSPFLVSDLTKSHLIFLRKDSEQRCIVLSPEELQKETFGGNIGELYLNAFFLKGSLVSHFAAEKIIALATRIKKAKRNYSLDDDLLLSQLGDRVIQTQIRKFLNDPD
ncbi:AAA family ATPase [Mucilaginibacter flavus]|nr:AAA family ATPase [Mucilaginibacter flavus]